MINFYRQTGIANSFNSLSFFSYFQTVAFFIIIMLSQTILAMVDINKATEEELARELSGIGSIKARRIVEYREKIKGFVSIEQLMEIKGIGFKTFARNRDKLVISSLSEAKQIPPPRLNLSPKINKPPYQARDWFWDALIIMPLFLVCLFIFIMAWLKSAKN